MMRKKNYGLVSNFISNCQFHGLLCPIIRAASLGLTLPSYK